MLRAAITACHNDFAAIQGGVKLLQLVNQFGCNQGFVSFSTLTPKFFYVEMWGKLGAIVMIIMID
jgi:hypothetical protein